MSEFFKINGLFKKYFSFRLVNLERKASMRRRRSAARESPFLGDIVHISSSGREERFNTSKYSSVSSTAAPRQRMRSRSAGRQSARLTGVSATNPLYNTTSSIGASTTSLNRQRASVLPTGKSSPYRNMIERPASTRPRNNLYTTTSAGAMSGGAYSADSNGASSPPPEVDFKRFIYFLWVRIMSHVSLKF